MKIEQQIWDRVDGWHFQKHELAAAAQLVFAFGDSTALGESGPMAQLVAAYPAACVVGCSTAGEIAGTTISEGSIVATAVQFDTTTVRIAATALASAADSKDAGTRLAGELRGPDLVHVLVFSEGLAVNGSELVRGLSGALPEGVAVTGGLSGDGAQFKRTVVFANGTSEAGRVVAIGLYGTHLKVGYGSLGGWDSFGPERLITKSAGNILNELDGESALTLYKRYLGPFAEDLPASGLRFPLAIRRDETSAPVVRTILGINEANQSLIFAGDVPTGSRARLMRANFDRLVDGAASAARTSLLPLGSGTAELAILISCVGRRLVLKQRCEEEVESVRAILGPDTFMTGFYSYGEISPFAVTEKCELHNQTMTITLLSEVA